MSILFFLLGIFFGSFFNVIIDRLPRGENFFVGRSHCDICRHTLSWYDLIPLFSFLSLFGKCRYCHGFIGWKYPVIELSTGILFASSYYISQGNSLTTTVSLFGIVSCLLIIFYIDLLSGIIPDVILVLLFLFALGYRFFSSQNFLPSFLTGVGCFVFFSVIFFLTRKRGIGFGDVKYAFVMGFLLGLPYIIAGLYVAFLTGACVALILVITKAKTMKSSIPFGPFLVIGTLITIFWGMQVWSVFAHTLGL